ncbi:hypothetical protein AnigIFM63604_009343 [Aspergillus niger]|uniref:Uncharacterized protein n=1 Tax=Aspergillus niger TaxID=5061 RepID=A0A9W6EDI0_ASPNG|nr:hypothetical protein AnigIFM59636_005553 [Aspergillus niger]GLA52481.1 hypothetical protein AnigIFM63604_009343 [Aspergillus niger]
MSEQIFTAAIGEKSQAAATRGYNGTRTWNRGKTQEQGNRSIYLVSERQMMGEARNEDMEHIPYLKTLSEAEAPYPKPLTEGDIRPGSPLLKLEKEDPKKHPLEYWPGSEERVVIHGDAARLRLPL